MRQAHRRLRLTCVTLVSSQGRSRTSIVNTALRYSSNLCCGHLRLVVGIRGIAAIASCSVVGRLARVRVRNLLFRVVHPKDEAFGIPFPLPTGRGRAIICPQHRSTPIISILIDRFRQNAHTRERKGKGYTRRGARTLGRRAISSLNVRTSLPFFETRGHANVSNHAVIAQPDSSSLLRGRKTVSAPSLGTPTHAETFSQARVLHARTNSSMQKHTSSPRAMEGVSDRLRLPLKTGFEAREPRAAH